MLVIDASVAAKWYLNEPDSTQALRWLQEGHDFAAPELLLVEVVNVLWRVGRKGETAPLDTKRVLLSLKGAIRHWTPDAALVERAAEIASSLDHPVYDCCYLACAERVNGVLLTADRRLANRVATTPWSERLQLLAEVQ